MQGIIPASPPQLTYCPFCGNAEAWLEEQASFCWVECPGCGAHSGIFPQSEADQAIQNWNRRWTDEDVSRRLRAISREILAENKLTAQGQKLAPDKNL